MQRLSVVAMMAVVASVVGAVSPAARGQCAYSWKPGDGMPGISGSVHAMTVWDPDGAGPQPPLLVVGGSFGVAGNVLANGIAAWNGTSWSALGTGMNGDVTALTVYNDNLIAGGTFTTAGGTQANYIAQWNGTSWSALGDGLNNRGCALAVYNGSLIAGGWFNKAGGNVSAFWAQWVPPPSPTAVCHNINKVLEDGVLTVNASEIDNGSTAGVGCALANTEIAKGSVACDAAGFALSASFNCSEIGAQPMTLRVTQGDGQQACCSATVTVTDHDTDEDNVTDCLDGCPNDANKTAPGQCGCGNPDTNTDGDGVADCIDTCPNTIPGVTVDAQGCPPLIPADFNHDGDVDNEDLTTFTGCASGPEVSHNGSTTCMQADLDQDTDVDSDDFGVFQRCYSGEDNPADPGCDG